MNPAVIKLALIQHPYRHTLACGCGMPCSCGCGCGWTPGPTSYSHYQSWSDHVLDVIAALIDTVKLLSSRQPVTDVVKDAAVAAVYDHIARMRKTHKELGMPPASIRWLVHFLRGYGRWDFETWATPQREAFMAAFEAELDRLDERETLARQEAT